MDLTPLIGPAVVAAAISALVAWFTTSRRFAVDRELAERKVTADIDLAERKFRFDKELAEHRVQLEAALAERKFAFDKDMIVWRRQYELAEQVLAAAYEARDVLSYARGRLIRSGEGKTRVATEPESELVREARDAAFIPIERLAAHTKVFAALQALQDSMLAHFGSEGMRPISEILAVYHGITTAAGLLIHHAEWNEDRGGASALQPFRDELWGDKATEANSKLDAAIKQLDAICKPLLAVRPPA